MSSLTKRLLTAIVLLPLILVAIHLSRLLLLVILMLVAVLGARELVRLCRALDVDQPAWLPAAGGVLLVITHPPVAAVDTAAAVLVLVLAAVAIHLFRRDGKMLLGASSTVFISIYVGLLPAYLLRLYDLPGRAAPDPWPVTFALLLVWGCDTGAFLAGSAIGRHKLWPRVSPAKTWEGALGGLIAGLALALALGGLVGELSLLCRIIAGLIVGVFGQIGDLAESLMKREASVKDSGGTFPGHGGVLDRLDSLVVAVPILYYWLCLCVCLP